MVWINYNGKILDSTTPVITADNRSLRYGYGLFETLKYSSGEILMWIAHTDRLWAGLDLLSINLPSHFTPDKLQKESLQLLQKNKLETARLRITVTGGAGGLFDGTEVAHYIIECWPLETRKELLNSNGLELCIYRDAMKSYDIFSNLKHNNFLLYVMAAKAAKKLKCNDAIILNQYGRICETAIANIFLIKNEKIYTPPLDEGCIAGTMRAFLLKNLPLLGFTVIEQSLTERDLWESDEIFTCNSVNSLRHVSDIENHSYGNMATIKLVEKLNGHFPSIY
ncbi:MAG: aminotransferase class IV [Ferruginibacter sp.]